MPTVEDTLHALADHPPVPARPGAEVRARARARTRRRHRVVAVAGVAVVVLGGVGVAALTTPSAAPDVTTRAEGGASTVPPAVVADGIAVAPASDLVEGDVLDVTLDPAPAADTQVFLAQCGTEVLPLLGVGDTERTLSWCFSDLTPAERPLRWTVQRIVDTPTGRIDCAEPDRCVLVARVGGTTSTDDRTAPLALRPQTPLVEPTVQVAGVDGSVADGAQVTVTVAGATPGGAIQVSQCIEGESCWDAARSKRAAVGPDGTATFTMRLFHDIAVPTGSSQQPAWGRCEPCVLVVGEEMRGSPLARLSLDMAPTTDPIRPTLEILPAGPLVPGATVTVRGSGFQPDDGRDGISLGWCVDTRTAPGSFAACTYPDAGGAVAGPDGTFEIAGFRLPGPGQVVITNEGSVACDSAPGVCGIAWKPGEGEPYVVFAPLDLTG